MTAEQGLQGHWHSCQARGENARQTGTDSGDLSFLGKVPLSLSLSLKMEAKGTK